MSPATICDFWLLASAAPAWPHHTTTPGTLVNSFWGPRIKWSLLSLALRTGDGYSSPAQAHASSQALCLFPSRRTGSLALPQIRLVISHMALFTQDSTHSQLFILVYYVFTKCQVQGFPFSLSRWYKGGSVFWWYSTHTPLNPLPFMMKLEISLVNHFPPRTVWPLLVLPHQLSKQRI